jgi:hypothetical protein
MIPINQVILGGGDPLLGTNVSTSIDEQLQLLERQKQVLETARQQRQQQQLPVQQPAPQRLIWDEIDTEIEPMTNEEKKKLVEMIEGGEGSEHFNDSYAKYTVSKMFHTEGGRKYVGEKFDMLKAKEICERYRGIIPQSATHGDVYVAINAQYHDYCELFKAWFGDSVDSKIIESAINFWFKDDDFKSGCKVWKYFNMM